MFPIRMNSDWRDADPQLFAEKSQARVPLQAFTVRWDTAHRAPGHWSPGATRSPGPGQDESPSPPGPQASSPAGGRSVLRATGLRSRGLRREAPPWGRSRADAHLRMAWNLCTRSL